MELGTSVVIAISYLGWTAAQLTALGLVFSTLSGGAHLARTAASCISGVVVLGYTIWGGMWSVAMTDLFQSVMIIVGLGVVAWLVGDMAGGAGKVIAAARRGRQVRVLAERRHQGVARASSPPAHARHRLDPAAGHLPARHLGEGRDAPPSLGSLLGGVVYFCFAFVPIFIVLAALMIDPALGKLLAAEDAREMQRILPNFILEHTPMWVAGAVLRRAALGDPLHRERRDHRADLAVHRERHPPVRPAHERPAVPAARCAWSWWRSPLAALLFALNSKQTMYDMVQNAYKVTLVAALRAARRRHLLEARQQRRRDPVGRCSGSPAGSSPSVRRADATVPPPLVGLGFSLFGMVLGSLAAAAAARGAPSRPRH